MQELLSELNHEITATQKLLDRLPAGQLAWQPHEKAMSLGQLALHVATIPGHVAGYAVDGTTTVAALIHHPEAQEKQEILNAFSQGISKARKVLETEAGDWGTKQWRLTQNDEEVLVLPSSLLARLLMLNHWYHHRGQLATYLRILDVSIPSIYGPSADENPF